MKCQKGPKANPGQKGRMSHVQRGTLRGGAPRYGLNRSMAPRPGMMAARPGQMPRRDKEFKVIELTDEMKAKMSKKQVKEYEKAVKNAKKEMAKAEKAMKKARQEMAKAREELKDARKDMKEAKQKARKELKDAREVRAEVMSIMTDLHHAKRYTQKANRIALTYIFSQKEANPVA